MSPKPHPWHAGRLTYGIARSTTWQGFRTRRSSIDRFRDCHGQSLRLGLLGLQIAEEPRFWSAHPPRNQRVSMRLAEAYQIYKESRVATQGTAGPALGLGGVLIAERHETRGGEDERALRKLDHGCSFFVSQAVYAVTASKNLLSDLYYRCQSEERPMPTVLVTLSPCGSEKTLAFMRWLGVSVPAWLRNELVHAHDILEKSVDVSLAAFEELHAFAADKRIPLGCNVESVSLRKAKIDASVEMVHRVAKLLGRN